MTISVCIGSACHLHGSYDVIAALKQRIAEHGLGDRVELKAAFCMGQCADHGVSVRIDDGTVQHLDPKDVERFFEAAVLNK